MTRSQGWVLTDHPSDLGPRCAGQKRRPGHATPGRFGVDSFQQTGVKRHIHPSRRPSVQDKWYICNLGARTPIGQIGIGQNNVNRTGGRAREAIFGHPLDMKGQSRLAAIQGHFNRITIRNTAGKVGKTDPETSEVIGVNKRDVAHDAFLFPTRLPIDRTDRATFDILDRMRNRHPSGFCGVFELPVVAFGADMDPSIRQKQSDDFSAVAFHQSFILCIYIHKKAQGCKIFRELGADLMIFRTLAWLRKWTEPALGFRHERGAIYPCTSLASARQSTNQ